MSVTAVPGAAADVLSGTPIAGSVDQIDAVGSFIADIRLDAWTFAATMSIVRQSLQGMEASAVTMVDAKIGEALIPGSSALQESADIAKQAFDAYAAEVARIHSDAQNLRVSVEEYLGSIRSQAGEVEAIARTIGVSVWYAWETAPPTQMPEPRLGPAADALPADEREAAAQTLHGQYGTRWLNASSFWQTGIEGVGAARTAWANLIEDRRLAENALIAALETTPVGQLITLAGGSGVPRRRVIANVIAGELWGTAASSGTVSKSHPLLEKLIGGASGEHIWHAPPDPAEVAANWERLSPEERERLIQEVPWVIGNLPGLPFTVRDSANREMVRFYQLHPHELSADQLKLMAQVNDILQREAGQVERYGEARPPIQIVSLDLTNGVPKVAVSYGNLDTASHTSWGEPGINSDAPDGLESWGEASLNLYAAQNGVSGFAGTNAVVAWLGYDTPSDPLQGDLGVFDSGSAEIGARRFAAELDGAYAARASGDAGVPVVNVFAHSYGTTLVTIALTQVSHPVDTLTLIASAGLDTTHVPSLDALKVKEASPGQLAIYTTHASRDHLAAAGAGFAGRGQPNPGAVAPLNAQNLSPVYGGALSFSSEGDPSRGLEHSDGHSVIGEGDRRGLIGLSASAGHGYFDRDTEALDTLAQITTGRIDPDLQRTFTETEAARPYLNLFGLGVPVGRHEGEWHG